MILAGLVAFFHYFDMINAGDSVPIGALISRSLILGPIASLAVSALFIAGLFLSVRVIHGKTRYAYMTSVIGRGMFLYVPAFLLWMIDLVWLDGATFTSKAEGGFLSVVLTVLKYACLLGVPVYTNIFLAQATKSKTPKTILMYVVGILAGGLLGAAIYLVFTLLANFVMVFNDPQYTFFFPLLS